MKTIFVLILAVFLISCDKGGVHGGPRSAVFLVGDSISHGYTPAVRNDIGLIYDVDWVPENSRNSTYTLEHVDEWIANEWKIHQPNLIVWNNGMWNCFHPNTNDIPIQYFYTSTEQYKTEIAQIAQKLVATGVKVIFVTTTYIPNSQDMIVMGHEQELNEAAKEVLPQYGIEILDIYQFSKDLPDTDRYLGYDIHYTENGYKKLGRKISDAILSAEDKEGN